MFFLTFLAEPPGSWLYTFVLLVALEAAAALALRQWLALRRAGDASRRTALGRLALATWAVFWLRGLTMLITLLIPDGTRDAVAILPPLDRAAAALTTLALVWVFVYPQPDRPGDLVALSLGVTTLIGLALEWIWWPPAFGSSAPAGREAGARAAGC